METIVNTLQLIGGLCLTLAYVPQVRQIIKTKSVNDFNPFYLSLVAVGVGLMEVYAIYYLLQGTAIMFFVTNTIAFLLGLLMLILYLVFRKSKKNIVSISYMDIKQAQNAKNYILGAISNFNKKITEQINNNE